MNAIDDALWGCNHSNECDTRYLDIKVCHVQIERLHEFITQLTKWVQETSWMTKLDKGTQRQYDYTVRETAKILVDIFKNQEHQSAIAQDFGEIMVSIGSARALEIIFQHSKLPLAELWKPQKKQNEGFDFHTLCLNDLINFGEAKYSSNNNPHGLAISQIEDFISQDKHFRDRAHLVNISTGTPISKLDNEEYGVIAAFSINSKNKKEIFKNAISSAISLKSKINANTIYLVGVSSH